MSETKQVNDRPMEASVVFKSKGETYRARIHFKSHQEMLTRASEKVVWMLQTQARGEQGFPQDRVVDVDADGNFIKTAEDYAKDVLNMSDSEKATELARAQAVLKALGAKMAAA